MKQAKTLILSLLTLTFTSTVAQANPDLQYALGQLNEAKMAIANGHEQRATNAILGAESAIYRVLGQANQGPQWVCIYRYPNHFNPQNPNPQYHGKGASKEEAEQNAMFDCSRDPSNKSPWHCDDKTLFKIHGSCRQI